MLGMLQTKEEPLFCHEMIAGALRGQAIRRGFTKT
jgi:hypothetical protein